ncbi:hypothetical protein ACHAQA_006847 [Verticillium albo-atrum]
MSPEKMPEQNDKPDTGGGPEARGPGTDGRLVPFVSWPGTASPGNNNDNVPSHNGVDQSDQGDASVSRGGQEYDESAMGGDPDDHVLDFAGILFEQAVDLAFQSINAERRAQIRASHYTRNRVTKSTRAHTKKQKRKRRHQQGGNSGCKPTNHKDHVPKDDGDDDMGGMDDKKSMVDSLGGTA